MTIDPYDQGSLTYVEGIQAAKRIGMDVESSSADQTVEIQLTQEPDPQRRVRAGIPIYTETKPKKKHYKLSSKMWLDTMIFGIVMPLSYLNSTTHPFIRHHAFAAVNVQLTALTAMTPFGLALLAMFSANQEQPGSVKIVAFSLVLMLGFLVNWSYIVLNALYGAVKARRGELYEPPALKILRMN